MFMDSTEVHRNTGLLHRCDPYRCLSSPASFVDSELPLDSQSSELLADTFDILSLKEMKLSAMSGPAAGEEPQEDEMAMAKAVLQVAQKKLVSQVREHPCKFWRWSKNYHQIFVKLAFCLMCRSKRETLWRMLYLSSSVWRTCWKSNTHLSWNTLWRTYRWCIQTWLDINDVENIERLIMVVRKEKDVKFAAPSSDIVVMLR